jgi:23S rRNA G2069 N7-methylase RlmK/C1962 C5-methylase RlmI
VLGGAGECVTSRLAAGRAGIQQVLHLDMSQAMLQRARSAAEAASQTGELH